MVFLKIFYENDLKHLSLVESLNPLFYQIKRELITNFN